MNYDKLNSKRTSMTVNAYLTDIITNKTAKMNFSPKYQRDDVWSGRQQMEYIQSIMFNTAPHNIILNYDKKNKEKICLDGKQRTTSLLNYHNNLVPVILGGMSVYFNKLPDNANNEDIDEKHKARIMTDDEMAVFLNREIGIIEYSNLTYDEQRTIFYKLQNGTKLSQGEKIIALLKGEKNAEEMNEFCKNYEVTMKRFVDVSRKAHYVIIVQYLFIANESTLLSNATKVNNHFKRIEAEGKLKDMLEDIKKPLDYSLAIFNSSLLKLNQKMFFTLLYAFNQNHAKLKVRKNAIIIQFLKDYHKKVCEAKIDMARPKDEVVCDLYNIFKDELKKLQKKSEIVNDDNEDDGEDEDEDDISVHTEDECSDDEDDEDEEDGDNGEDGDENDDDDEDNNEKDKDYNTESEDENNGHDSDENNDTDDEVLEIPVKNNKIKANSIKKIINKTNKSNKNGKNVKNTKKN